MQKTLLSTLVCVAVAVTAAPAKNTVATVPSSQQITTRLIASPQAAVYADLTPAKIMGKDFWLGLDQEWHALKGVSDEAFVKDSCPFHVRLPVEKINAKSLRTGIIREIELFDTENKNIASSITFTFTGTENNTLFLRPQHINDGNTKTLCVFTADHSKNEMRYKKVYGTLQLNGSVSSLLSMIRIYHGNGSTGELEQFALLDKSGRRLETISMSNDQGMFTAKLKNAEPCGNIVISFSTTPFRIVIKDLPPDIAEKAKVMPFEIWDLLRMGNGNLLGLGKENFDRQSFEKFLSKFKDTFMGFGISEFDSNYQQLRRPGNPNFSLLAGYIPRKDENRADAEKNMRNLFLYQKELFFDHVYTLSGGVMGSPYFGEWGSRNLILEYSCRTDRSARILMAMTKGAARQYHVPWGFYMAYYAALGSPHSRSVHGPTGLDYGQPPSHGLRAMLMNYYMGGNYQWLESQPWGQVVETEKGMHKLTENGKVLKAFYDWTQRTEGKRGTQYTPLLFLMDYLHGQTGRPDWKVWYHLPMEDGDFMAKHFFDAVSPLDNKATFASTPEHCINIANSPIGDIFDIFFANPPSGETTLEELGKYAVVILADDIRFTAKLKENLKEYVKLGGTLVINSGHAAAFRDETAFLGLEINGKFFLTDDMQVAEINCLSATPVLMTSDDKPLITKNSYGQGNVIFTTPYFMLMTNKKARSPLIGQLLEKIQQEILPVNIVGDIHFIFNRMDDSSWKLLLMNNRGVAKDPLKSEEKRFSEFDSTVRITVPTGATAKEIYASDAILRQENTYSVTVPAGGVRIVELRNVEFGTPLIHAAFSQRKPLVQKWEGLCQDEPPPKPPLESREIIAEWTFDEGSGKSVQDRVNGNTIKLYHDPQFVKVNDGYALKFDGNKTFGQGSFPIQPDKIAQISVECWVKPDISPESVWSKRMDRKAGFVFHGGNNSFAMGIEGKQWFHMTSYNGYVYENILNVENGKWAHLVFTWKDFIARFYVNGIEAIPSFGVFKLSGITTLNKFPVYLGTHYHNPGSGSSRVFNGLIDELRFLNYSLSEQEIRERYNQGRKKYEAK
jgi:hypothetical protein